jgi:hypothetical protein
LKLGVTGAVTFEALARAVVLEAVELDDDLFFAPEGVDPVAEELGVRLGPLEAGLMH